MESIGKIIKAIDDELIKRNKIFISLGQANKILENKEILTSDDVSGKELKKILEEGKIPNSSQTSEKPKQWRIFLSDKGKKQKIIADKRKAKEKLVEEKFITICPYCGINLVINKVDTYYPSLICLNCNNNFENPFFKKVDNKINIKTETKTEGINKAYLIGAIIILVIGFILSESKNGGGSTYTTQPGHMGAYSESNLDKLTEYSIHGDYDAINDLIYKGLIFEIPAGKEAYVIDTKFSIVKIRLKGEGSEIWTVIEAIKRK